LNQTCPALKTLTESRPQGLGISSAGQAQRFFSAHDQINNLFHLRPAHQYRAARTQAFQTWAEVTGVAVAA
jgi:putative transposase